MNGRCERTVLKDSVNGPCGRSVLCSVRCIALAGFVAAERDEFATLVWRSFLGSFFCGFTRLAAIVSVSLVLSISENGVAEEFLYVFPPRPSAVVFRNV